MCIERCMHGSEGGVGASSSEVPHAYPTRDPAEPGLGGAQLRIKKGPLEPSPRGRAQFMLI